MAEKMVDWLQFKTRHILIKMDEDDDKVEVDGQLTAESIKTISESMGISNLNDEAINLLIDDGTYRLKQLAQVSVFSVLFRAQVGDLEVKTERMNWLQKCGKVKLNLKSTVHQLDWIYW